jgi:foldase protein PrsA
MKRLHLGKVLVVAALTVVCGFALVACSSSDSSSSSSSTGIQSIDTTDVSGGVAATVGDAEIGENAITNYIQNFRILNGYEDEDTWGQWLADNGYSVEDIRQDVIDYYVDQEVIRQAAEENGITVDEDSINSEIEQIRANYDTDEDWIAALNEVGMADEQQYRDLLEVYQLQQSLEEVVAPETDPSDEDVISYANMYLSYLDGAKKSSQILFSSDDEATAQDVLNQINNGEISFEDAAAQYSTDTSSASDGGNVGWDVLSSFVTEYQDALDQLDEGQVSGLVTSSYGIHIIKCTEVFHAPDELTSLDQLPDEFVEQFRSAVASSNQQTTYQEWFSNYKSGLNVTTNDMPDGLPYYVDVTAYESSDTSSDTTSSDTTTDTSSSSSDSSSSSSTSSES